MGYKRWYVFVLVEQLLEAKKGELFIYLSAENRTIIACRYDRIYGERFGVPLEEVYFKI
jgi:hypothetical protein